VARREKGPHVDAHTPSSSGPSPLEPAWAPASAPAAGGFFEDSSVVFGEPPALAAWGSAPALAAPAPVSAPAAAAAPSPGLAPPLLAAPATPPAAPAAPVLPPLPTGGLLAGLPEQGGPVMEETAVRVGAEDTTQDSAFLSDLLLHVLETGCSDLHLTVGAPPTVRLNGRLVPLEDYGVLSPQLIQKTLYAVLTQRQREKFEQHLELDFAYSIPGRARFRVNLYRQRDAVGAAFRLIPYDIKKLEDLGVPPSVANFAMLQRGFVLVTGPTGSGKSTTLAGIVDLANRQRHDHIMTVEDPIEFLHEPPECTGQPAEVGEDTWSFKNALKHVLRQDPTSSWSARCATSRRSRSP
jgi:twitching motility protein PilT